MDEETNDRMGLIAEIIYLREKNYLYKKKIKKLLSANAEGVEYENTKDNKEK
jgi:hypothetical protein